MSAGRVHSRTAVRLAGWLFALLLLVALCFAGRAHAHAGSTASLRLAVQERAVDGEIALALRDLDLLLALDADGDGAIRWGELHAREVELRALVAAGLVLEADGAHCAAVGAGETADRPLAVDASDAGTDVIVPLAFRCPATPHALTLRYALLFDLDALHRALVRLDAHGRSQAAVLAPEARERRFALDLPGPAILPFHLIAEGARHVFGGADHVAFLVTLLLPAVLVRERRGWRPAPRFGAALRATLSIVTAFTLAHSLTLGLAALGVVRLPVRLVESTIAATVALAALHNLRAFLPGPAAGVAFGFGLVHGLGFASAFGTLELSAGDLVPALLGFNLGVELGQLAIVAVLLPLAFWLRGSWLYQRGVLAGGSLAIALVSAVWWLERIGLA